MASQYRDFMGAKLALFAGGKMLSLQRDDRPGLLWPGYWDLPGGGREGTETPLDCVIRETREELSIPVLPSHITWARAYTNTIGRTVWFMVGVVQPDVLGQVQLGDEGQRWAVFSRHEFMGLDKAVPQFQQRLQHYFDGMPPDPGFGKTPR